MKIKTLLFGAIASSALASAAFAERGSDGNVNIIFLQVAACTASYLCSVALALCRMYHMPPA